MIEAHPILYIDFLLIFATAGVVVLGVMVAMLMYSVILRKVFNAPLEGVFELSEFGMVLVTFLFLAEHYLKPDSMVLDTFVEMFPKKLQAITNTFIYFLDVAILVILSWQLFVYGARVQSMNQVSKILELPLYVFVDIGGVCTVLLTLVFTVKFLLSLDSKFWRA